MVVVLRVFGGIASFNAVFFFVGLFVLPNPYRDGIELYAVLIVALHVAFAVLWFWLASLISSKRKAEWQRRMMLPCQQCGSEAAIGFRVCRTCGRVKAPGIWFASSLLENL
ncbi:hypothetical protein [Microbacterium maritypicum]